jgi:flagellar basal-body rod modification protein FlgD
MTDIAPTQTQIPISAVTERQQATIQPKNELDKDAFLQLLVAQLRYQNPLSPSDPNQFMAQTAQFTMVESLQALAADTSAQRAIVESMTATGLLGKEITWVDTNGEEHTGVVTGTGFSAQGTTLEVGDESVALERVTGARMPGTAPVAATDEPTNPTTDGSEATDGIDPTNESQEA